MNLSDHQQQILRMIAVGRSSLDHIVDTLQVDCERARTLAEDLVANSYIRPRGHLFESGVIYELSEMGRGIAATLLSSRSEMAARLHVLDDEWSVISRLSDRPLARRILETDLPEIAPGAMQSILVHLEELSLVRITGFFQVYARLTQHALSRLA
jgi:hypothetical protein